MLLTTSLRTAHLPSSPAARRASMGQGERGSAYMTPAPLSPPPSPKLAEELAHVAYQQVGRFQGREVAAAVELRPVDDVVALLGEAPDRDVLGEDRHPSGHRGGRRPVARVHALVVQV